MIFQVLLISIFAKEVTQDNEITKEESLFQYRGDLRMTSFYYLPQFSKGPDKEIETYDSMSMSLFLDQSFNFLLQSKRGLNNGEKKIHAKNWT